MSYVIVMRRCSQVTNLTIVFRVNPRVIFAINLRVTHALYAGQYHAKFSNPVNGGAQTSGAQTAALKCRAPGPSLLKPSKR